MLERRECSELWAQRALIGSTSLLLVAACSRSGGVPEGESSASGGGLRVGFIGLGENVPVGAEGWANRQGDLGRELQKLGFDRSQFFRFPNGPDLNEALSGGSLDLGIYGDTPAIVGRAAGLPTRLVNQSVVGLDAWLLTRADGPASVDELAGKIVATSKGSYMHRYLSGLLVEHGLADKVQVAHLLPTDAQAALERGDIAAYAAPVQLAPLLTARGARVIDRASDHPGLTGSSVTVVTLSFLAAHPDFPRAWNAMRERAIADLERYADTYYAFHAETVRIPVDAIRASYPLTLFVPVPLGPAGLDLLEGTKRFLVDQGLAQSDFSIREWAVPDALQPVPSR